MGRGNRRKLEGQNKEVGNKHRRPRLPGSLRRQLNRTNFVNDHRGEEVEDEGVHLPLDIYEYEESEAPEEIQKNRRYDDVDRLEFELPSDFEDEEIDEEATDGVGSFCRRKNKHHRNSEEEGRDDENGDIHDDNDEDAEEGQDRDDEHGEELQGSESELECGSNDERHHRMIEAVKGSRMQNHHVKWVKHRSLLSEAYPESEFNINPSVDASHTDKITVDDLMTTLQGTTGFGSLRKRMQQLQKKGMIVDAPLPKVVQEKVNRQAGYVKTRDEISKWQDIVKKNREAPTVVFTNRPNLMAMSTAELASKFEPTTKLEKEVASLLQESGHADASIEIENTLGFKKFTVAEVKERQERFVKMRNQLFYHETKAKRMKKIKSKAFHRLLQKDHKSNRSASGELDAEALQEAALKAELTRAQERMTLKHKNTSRWAKRIIKRGLKAKNDGNQEAIAEQLRTHAALTRKIHSADNANSSDDTGVDLDASADELGDDGLETNKPRERILARAKVETLKVLEGDAEMEIPSSGLFALPFMARAIEKKRKEAHNEALAVLEQLEQLDGNGVDVCILEDTHDADDSFGASSGRLGFGTMAHSFSVNVNPSLEGEQEMLVDEGSSDDDKVDDREMLLNEPSSRKNSFGDVTLLKQKPANDSRKLMASTSNGTIIPSSSDFCSSKVNPISSRDIAELMSSEVLPVQSMAFKDCNEVLEGEKPNFDNPLLFGSIDEVTHAEIDSENIPNKLFRKSKPDGRLEGEKPEVDNPWLFGSTAEGRLVENDSGYLSARNLRKAEPVSTLIDSAVLVNGVGKCRSLKAGAHIMEVNVGSSELELGHDDEIRGVDGVFGRSDDDDGDEHDELNVDEVKMEKGFELFTGNESQAELIQQAFAGDDVQADFREMKEQVLNEEAPLGEGSVSLPGWGQWTDVQKKIGQPTWMIREQEQLKKKREIALNKRKDSKLKYAVISEKTDKKAAKFTAPLPFPFDSKKTYERSIRMPIGREYNTDQAFRDMIRPSVLKDAGTIIDPIKYKMSETRHAEVTMKKGGVDMRKQKQGGPSRISKSRKVLAV